MATAAGVGVGGWCARLSDLDAEGVDGCTGGERCEAFLSVAAINLLRGVTPPCEGPDAAGADYGRYGAETPAERYARVLSRPADKLFCMECVRAYALSPAGVAPAPANVPS